MTPTIRCSKCGRYETIPPLASTLTVAETAAVAHGWNLASYRTAVAGLTSAAATVVRESIPSAPDLFARVRAAARQPLTGRAASTDQTIPPAPSLASRLRPAAGAR